MLNVLIVDDEPAILLSVSEALREDGHVVCLAKDGDVALKMINNQVFDLLICDNRLPYVDGMTIFRHVRHYSPSTDILFMTAFGQVSDAVKVLKEGAVDYLVKPFRLSELKTSIEKIDKSRELCKQFAWARATVPTDADESPIVGHSPALKRTLDRIESFAHADYPVLITGESGTGKELVARLIHDHSNRCKQPMVAVNCAAFPETLLESELFGYKRGAFTGAFQDREGRFKAAHGGTLFLDEIAEIPLVAQAKLLRVLQEGYFEPLGTNQSINVDVRIISATHRDLREWVREGRFREDLYYRLNVLSLHVPPLRERVGDLPVLIEHFLRRFHHDTTHNGYDSVDDAPRITPAALTALTSYHYPGNVRELEHAIQSAGVLARGTNIDVQHLPVEIAGHLLDDIEAPKDIVHGFQPLAEAMNDFERQKLIEALEHADKRMDAANMLGISRKNLWQKLQRHDLLHFKSRYHP